MIEVATQRTKDYHEEAHDTWFQAHHAEYVTNVELRQENDRLRQRLRAANLKLLNNIGTIGALGAPPTAAARVRSRTPIRRRARSADPGARGAPHTGGGDTGARTPPVPDLLPPTPDNIMKVVEAQRVYIGELRNQMEQMGCMPRTPIPSLMSMAIPGSPRTPFATNPGGSGAIGAPHGGKGAKGPGGSGALGAPYGDKGAKGPGGGKGAKGKPLMCPAGPRCRTPYCTFVHVTTPVTSPRGTGALGAPPDLLMRQETGPMTMTPGAPRGDGMVGAPGAPLPRLLTGLDQPAATAGGSVAPPGALGAPLPRLLTGLNQPADTSDVESRDDSPEGLFSSEYSYTEPTPDGEQ